MQKLVDDTDLILAVNKTLSEYFERAIDEAARINPSYQKLWEELYRLSQSGGKRLRPQLALLAYATFGGQNLHKIVPVASAHELLHFSLLIHDDIIDRDFIRYGTLNISGMYKGLYAQHLDSEEEQLHFANGAALLAGNLMLSGAYQLIHESELDEFEKNTALGLLSKSIFEVAGGELLDTESSFVPYTTGDALNIAKYKTAGYTFVIPLVTGATLAGASEDKIAILTELGTVLGVAYQHVDDLISIFGNEDVTGKSSTGDILEGKRTFMVEQALARMTDEETRKFNTIFGNSEATEADMAYVKQLLVSTGAKQATEDMIAEYAERSRSIIALLDLSEDSHEHLVELVELVTHRAF